MRFHDIISESLLQQAVAELVKVSDASLPSPDECQHKFSAAFEEKCRLLSKTWKKVDFVPMRVYTLIVKGVETWRIRLILLSIASKSIKVLDA